MTDQIRLLRRAPEITHGCPTVIGLIVHRPRQLQPTPQGTAEVHVLRSTLQGVGDLLLSGRMPKDAAGYRPRVR
jgi:hypothetical protein